MNGLFFMKNKVESLYEMLLEQIRRGNYKAGEKFPSEYELADMYGINKSTANKAVGMLVANNYLHRTLGRGGTIVSANNYISKGVIGYKMLLLSGGTYSAQLLKGAQMAASANGYSLQYMEYEFPEDEHWERIGNMPLKGVLFTASSCPPDDFKLPAINVGISQKGNYLFSDSYRGGQLAAEHLYSRGHRRVVCISNEKREGLAASGFFDRMKEFGIHGNNCRHLPIADDNMNCAAVWEHVNQKSGVTAAFCISDMVAMRMMLYLRSVDVLVPRDFSICGFGYMRLIQKVCPMTSIDQFPLDMGYSACTNLIHLIEGKETGPIQIKTPVELVNPDMTVGYLSQNK